MSDYRIITTSEKDEWLSILGQIRQKWIVHFPDYVRVYEEYGDGNVECFVYEDGKNILIYPYIRRVIDDGISSQTGSGFTDIVTPYGYGGYVHSDMHRADAITFLSEFRRTFESYARENGIVSEFIRFHPELGNHTHSDKLLDSVVLLNANAALDLSAGKEAIFLNYRNSYRQCIKKARNHGLTASRENSNTFMDEFFALYNKSMISKGQKGYLNFDRNFLGILTRSLGDNLMSFAVRKDGEVISGALFLQYEGLLDYFLAASNPDYLNFRPNHLLIDEAVNWAIENEFRRLHLGGGHTSLQFFKNGFANESCPYYIGHHVHDRDTYDALSAEHWRRNGQEWTGNNDYFPAYRTEFQ